MNLFQIMTFFNQSSGGMNYRSCGYVLLMLAKSCLFVMFLCDVLVEGRAINGVQFQLSYTNSGLKICGTSITICLDIGH